MNAVAMAQYAQSQTNSGWPAPPWSHNPPFAGPPPIPQGVNPQQWAAGHWQYNPAWNGQHYGHSVAVAQSAPSATHWAPGNGWNVPAEHAVQPPPAAAAASSSSSQSHNPYKRIPKQPDPSYWENPLLKNPLGLENMIPRGERQDRSDTDIPPTPWIWNPPGLVHSDSEEMPIAADLAEMQSRRKDKSRHSQDQQRRPSTDGQHHQQDRPRGSSTASQQAAHARAPSPLGRSTDHPSAYHRQRPSERTSPHSQASSNRHATTSPAVASDERRETKSHHAANEHRKYSIDDHLAETFTSKMDLHPTFSPNIIRLPGHLRSLPSHDSHDESQSKHMTPPPADGRIPGLGRPKSTARHSSLPNPTSSSSDTLVGLSNFVDEPSSVLSPLVGAPARSNNRTSGRSHSDPSHGRPLHRSQTDSLVPGSLGTITEGTVGTGISRRGSEVTLSASAKTPSPPSASRSQAPRVGPSPTHDRRSPQYYNPLPPPPQEQHNPITSAPLLPRIPPPPGSWRIKVRRGFWNKRGDYLTRDGYIVYAPEDRAWPEELKDYPSDAYINETGDRVEYVASRPELPESLPRHGRPPLQPYDMFVQYDYLV